MELLNNDNIGPVWIVTNSILVVVGLVLIVLNDGPMLDDHLWTHLFVVSTEVGVVCLGIFGLFFSFLESMRRLRR